MSPLDEELPRPKDSQSYPADVAKCVNVDDKRIISGQTNVNQLVPFKYKWAWDKYLAGCANYCMPQENVIDSSRLYLRNDVEQDGSEGKRER